MNSKLVPLEQTRQRDVVEIFTAKSAAPAPARTGFAFASPRARSKIRTWFSRERREEAVEKAASNCRAPCAETRSLPVAQIVDGPELQAIAADLHLTDIAALYRAIGDHHTSTDSVIERLVASRVV